VGRRLAAVAVLALSLVVVPSASPVPGGRILGAQRILVALVTWGPQPFARKDLQRLVFDQADAFYKKTSYGKASLTGVVTPWLNAFEFQPGCAANNIREPAVAKLRAAGYDLSAYDVVILAFPYSGCPWPGATYAGVVYLNGDVSAHVIEHELGHAFGLPHANTTDCIGHSCAVLEYGDPYDTMGIGTGDFSAYAKAQLGWVTRVTRVVRPGEYTIAPLERASGGSQAFVVTTARDLYWIEYRTEPARNDRGAVTSEPGVLVHVSESPDVRGAVSSNTVNALVTNPARRARPELHPGDRFTYPSAFRLTVLRESASGARLRFAWVDKVPPRAPRVTGSVAGGRLSVEVAGGRETGSGVARYEITVDGRPRVSVSNDATDEPVRVGRPLPGTHSVKVVAVDRAGNRSAPAVIRVRVL
jgi:hypothetical protein